MVLALKVVLAAKVGFCRIDSMGFFVLRIKKPLKNSAFLSF
jgi:hypothetical protein